LMLLLSVQFFLEVNSYKIHSPRSAINALSSSVTFQK
jgi:hypothetical protein